MTHYRTYLLDAGGQISAMRQLVCETDDEAREQAKTILRGQTGEVWSGQRKVARFEARARSALTL
jgi:hypothetical protein